MSEEYTPTMAGLRMDFSRVRGSAFDPEAQARQAELESLFDRALAAHDAEIRRDQAEKDARIATRGLRHWEPVNSDYEPSPKIANAIRAQFTPSPEAEQEKI